MCRFRKEASAILLFCALGCGLTQPAASMPLHELAGTYEGCRGERIVLDPSGTIQWQSIHFPGGTDMAKDVRGSGTIEADGDWLRLTLDPGSLKTTYDEPVAAGDYQLALARRFYPVRIHGRTFMLDENDLVGLVNAGNRFFPPVAENTACFTQQPIAAGSAGSSPNVMPVETLLPTEYRQLLQARPLAGKVMQVGPVSKREVNVAGWMRPADMREESSASITVDLGTSSGVFRGMRLFLGSPVENEIIVEAVEADRSYGTARWVSAGRPSAGMPISSAAVIKTGTVPP
jgi:hypothetical protein